MSNSSQPNKQLIGKEVEHEYSHYKGAAMTQIDEPNLDELDELQKECNIDEYGTTGENAYYIFKRFRKILATQIQEARINEMERFANAKINHQGEPALFNPDGLPISTPITEEMTRLVNQAAKDRIAQLRSTPNEDMDN